MPIDGKDGKLPEPVAAAVAAGTNIVRALRESKGYSVEDLALTCGLAIGEISEIESGGDADPGKLRRIASALGLSEHAFPRGLSDPASIRSPVQRRDRQMTSSIYDIPLARIDGAPTSLADYAGKVLLIVNVASKCGMTPQYEGLESLYRTYHDRGLVVLGFPANDFAGQEPGTEAEIGEFCRSTYGVEFPMFSKIVVTGPDKHPLYEALISALPETEFKSDSKLLKRLPQREAEPGGIHWNFEKFLIGRDGSVIARFAPDTKPEDESVVRAIETALAA